MNNKFLNLTVLCSLLMFMFSCSSGKQQSTTNWMAEYDVNVAIDESFKPIMADLVESYGMANKEANMKPVYVSEDSAIRLLLRDSLRCCIATRKLNQQELDFVKANNLGIRQSLVAYDAIALVVNKSNKDSLITLQEIKDIVTGKITRWEQLSHHAQKGELKLVFDHSGSSTVRYMRDSLCNGNDLKGNVFASEGKTNQSVLEMVKADPTIIGVVGANWLKPDSSSVLTDFRNLDFNVMRVCTHPETYANYVRPYQHNIYMGYYPLIRTVYIMNTDPRTSSHVRNFYFFVKGQKGQTIICNDSQLLPNTPVQVKNVNVN